MIKNRLSEIMGAKRMTMSELAKLSGLDPRTISKIYHATNKGIEIDTLNKLCWALDCNTQDLFRYEEQA